MLEYLHIRILHIAGLHRHAFKNKESLPFNKLSHEFGYNR